MIMIISLRAPFDTRLPVQCRLALFPGDVFRVGAFSSLRGIGRGSSAPACDASVFLAIPAGGNSVRFSGMSYVFGKVLPVLPSLFGICLRGSWRRTLD